MTKHFEFGKNWSHFLHHLNNDRIKNAVESLCEMLEIENLKDKTFLDIGSGSGLFSLAAMNLHAGQVYSFDYDKQSVDCTAEIKCRYFPNSDNWTIKHGSVLDTNYLNSLGQFDIVYSWGVLHHTGQMWQSLKNVVPLVRKYGKLYIAIYNDQGRASYYWKIIKRIYNNLPKGLKFLILCPVFIRLWGFTILRDILLGKAFHTWKNYERTRGMSPWCDVVDWVGGWPFEVAKPEEIFEFFKKSGFTLEKLKTCGGGYGNNEFVFTKL
ncbi:MAG: class I SAM-dependent methyltransferase [Elusimicrobiota bacterium]|nr:class I SAM-dependent methyltransferase [Elusimicrobiota bacterium]